MLKNTVIIYNASDIDSVFAAMVLFNFKVNQNKVLFNYDSDRCNNGVRVRAYSATNIPKLNPDDIHYWVGVEPSHNTMEFFLRKAGFERSFLNTFIPSKNKKFKHKLHHEGFFSHDSKYAKNNPYFAATFYYPGTIVNNSSLNSDSHVHVQINEKIISQSKEIYTDVIFHDSLLKTVFGFAGIESSAISCELLKNVIDFKYQLRHLDIEEQATLYVNYQHAVNALANNKTYYFKKATNEDVETYLSFMKNVKRQISNSIETNLFDLGAYKVQVPMINVSQTLSPWVLKLLGNQYSFAITYEQRKRGSILSIYSSIAGFDNVVLNEMKRNKINCRLANQL